MNNYIILNGVNSNTITGLIISSLPPITKPLMRTNIETIDGKDGDIITKLGYSAYDKEITIGLSYNYNVDDVIKYFNSEGTVIFSNEPTKYYKYTILDQIDFEKLIRFKTATVRMHVQPFKYSSIEEDIEENATETDAEGTNFTLENTENGAGFIDLKLKGDTYQETTTGKNLLPTNKYISTKTINGVTFTNNGDGTFNLSGTATANTTIIIIPVNIINLEVNQPYYLYSSIPYDLNTFNLSVAMTENSTAKFITANNTYTPTTTPTNVRLQFYIGSGKSVNATNVQLMLVKGTTAPSNYEKYTGGIASPNPNYPQDIDVVTGENTVTLCGKNLLQHSAYDRSLNGITLKVNNDQSITLTGTAIANTNFNIGTNADFTLGVGTYTFSKVATSVQVLIYYSSTSVLANLPIGTQTKTFTLNTDTTYNNYRVVISIPSGTTVNETVYPMLEKGTTATSYQPYQSQSYTLSLGDIELCKIGNYQDKLYYDSGKWYKQSKIGKVVLNGTETINSISNNRFQIAISPTAGDGYSTLIAKCNLFKPITQLEIVSTTKENVFAINGSNSYIRVTSSTTEAQLRTILSNNNAIIYYVLATATDTEITDETLLSQLNALNGATTYEGQTNIITAGDLQPIIYVKTYAMDNPSYTVTNSGNYFAKPVMTIYGIGTVGVYLDGVQVLSLALNENQTDHITIDVPNMNAYTDTLNTLRNRAVIGDYNNLKFNVGDNELSFSGTIQGFIIQNYSRWL